MGELLKYSNDGVPKTWDGKDWYTYKWAMDAVFREKGMLGIADGTSKRETLSTAEGTAKFDQMLLQIRRMVDQRDSKSSQNSSISE
ncbi:hypothetical protein PC116_g23582 [Phytophthora cactorum]|uniref:Uncharacterized protein n=1 Tax=Phytophthora cactorum TaxID=29920 RepID=A0A8T1JYD2_9STRA|nr:hypothetical protein PC113_g19502 [Phytophthora cactorum]KAG2892040.1 hypothetical protein PC115_g18997 [Phytophthora cactorum]KAG2903847.1 hypothetical protein PC117_g21169 [Phytophthora cactorum]KAG2966420.1 hypothetical protein PC118_g19191 [Phytophthora cactorum]KAG3046710.1 hypothetical protein PC121_g20514 [Phytophthora cactorum]